MTARKSSDPPAHGDLIEVHWVDIAEDSTGDPSTATLSRRTSYGLYWGHGEDGGIPVIVTTTTLDVDVLGQSGYCIYPVACVVKLLVVRRARRRKPKTS